MTSPVLFSTGASPATNQAMRNLVEFKAGKMEMRDKMVHPIKRQGLVYLRQSQDDNLMHFCWKDRQSGVVEDDLILFPDDCEFKRVQECTTGRVFVLKMKSSNRKMFFWMQESRQDRDDDFCKKINEMLNNPPSAGIDMGGGGGGGGGGSGSSDRDLQALFGNMTQEQVAHLLSSNGVNLTSLLNSATGRSPSSNSGNSASSTASTTNSSAPTSATSGGASAAAALASGAGRDSSPNINDFRALISGALMEGNEDALMAATMAAREEAAAVASGQQQQQQQQQQAPLIDLSTVMNSESLAHLLMDEQFLRQVEPHLPQITPTQPTTPLSADERKKQFGETIRSSQFRSSLSQFCDALQSGQLGPLMSQFGLNQACVDAANLGNLEAFVRALELQTGSSSTTTTPAAPESSPAPGSGAGQPPSEPKDKN